MIKFLQHSSPKYPPRTFENASADATIAFAFDFNTPGEKLTKEAVKTQGKIYLHVDVRSEPSVTGRLHIANQLINASTLNIAGNQLCTIIKNGYTQHQTDESVYRYLGEILELRSKQTALDIQLIRSGGQSGFDEAGLKAAARLGIPALCLCPQGWKFNDATGKVICDEQRFKNRFPNEFIM